MDFEDILKELQANKELFNSSFSDEEKIDAYRKQSIILDELTESTPESEKPSLFRLHLKEFTVNDDGAYSAYTEARSKNVEKLLRSLPRCSSDNGMSVEEFLKEHQCLINARCTGKYRCCIKDEVDAGDLKMFRTILGEVPSTALIGSSLRKTPIFGETDDGISTTSGRQSIIDSFLPKKQDLSRISGFRTAREEMVIQNTKKNANASGFSNTRTLFNYGASKKSLGARRNVRSGFVPPIQQAENMSLTGTPPESMETLSTEPIDERLHNIDPKMIELISNEIMHKYKPIGWDDIAGLDYAKATIKEAVVWPLLRPDIFTGLRRPPRGILLFGPPGTGKTLIGKCIASQSRSTFFSISASSLASKWVGDAEKMVRALFAVAAVHQPSVVFIDEIDSLLSQRSGTEHESSRRLKTEFLVQLDGANTREEERILIVGATNRPQELDEAARRRLIRRLYIPLPELSARMEILTNLLQTVNNSITSDDISEIGNSTDGYSGADMESLCREASMEPIRAISPDEIVMFSADNVRPVNLDDFHSALNRVRPSVSQADLQQFEEWNRVYGAGQ